MFCHRFVQWLQRHVLHNAQYPELHFCNEHRVKPLHKAVRHNDAQLVSMPNTGKASKQQFPGASYKRVCVCVTRESMVLALWGEGWGAQNIKDINQSSATSRV